MKYKLCAVLILLISVICLCSCKGITSSDTQMQLTARPTVRVTVPEGYTVYQIAKLLEDNQVCSRNDFLAAVNSPPEGNGFAAAIANGGERPFLMEGYAFPDTYDFYVGESAESALNRLLRNMNSKLTDDDYNRAGELGYSMDQIITIASLVQAESGFKEQDAKVASVLYNRLKSNNFPHLESNVTFEYLDNSVEPFITGGRKKFNSFYNTYVCRGLPAGPICNPGRNAIAAALYPADTDYYYFVTDKNGNYYYSHTYAQHLANCKKAGVTTG